MNSYGQYRDDDVPLFSEEANLLDEPVRLVGPVAPLRVILPRTPSRISFSDDEKIKILPPLSVRRASKKVHAHSTHARKLRVSPSDVARLEKHPKAVRVLGVFDQKPHYLRETDLDMIDSQERFATPRPPPLTRRLSAHAPVVAAGPFNVRRRHMRPVPANRGEEADKRGRMLGVARDELDLFIRSPKACKVLGVGNETPQAVLSQADLQLIKRQAFFRDEIARQKGERRRSIASANGMTPTGVPRHLMEGDQLELFQHQPKAYKVLGMEERQQEDNQSSSRGHSRRPSQGPDPRVEDDEDNSHSEGEAQESIDEKQGYVPEENKGYVPRSKGVRRDKRAAVLGVPFREIDRFREMPKAYKLSGLWSQNVEPVLRPEDADLVKKQSRLQRRSESNLGMLRVMLKYDSNREILRAVVLEAKGLAITDRRLDARVHVSLVDAGPAMRPMSKVLKTSIQKNNINPIFDEAFLFPMAFHMLDECHLLLSVRDRFLGDEWLGSVLIPLCFLQSFQRPDCRWHQIRDGFVLESVPTLR